MLLFYASQRNQAVEVLEGIVSKMLPAHKVMYCSVIDAVEKRLRRPRQNLELLLVSVQDAIEMARLTQMRALLLDMRLILVLPQRDEAMVAWAHKLGPRFIAYADIGVEQVAPVLEKMLSNLRPYEPISEH